MKSAQIPNIMLLFLDLFNIISGAACVDKRTHQRSVDTLTEVPMDIKPDQHFWFKDAAGATTLKVCIK